MSEAHTMEAQETASGDSLLKILKPVFIAGLVIYFLFLVIAKTPASIAAWAVHKAVPTLWLTSVQGTLWNGRSGGAQVDLGTKVLPLGKVKWRLNPWSLLILRPCLSFETQVPGQSISGNFCQSPFGSASVEDFSLDVPISTIKGLLPVDDAVGQLSITVISAELQGQKVQSLDARFSWQNASVYAEGNWFNLGSFGGKASPNGEGGVQVQVNDISATGPFGVDMILGWTPGVQNWTLAGTVTPRSGASDGLVQALQVIGEEKETGVYTIAWP